MRMRTTHSSNPPSTEKACAVELIVGDVHSLLQTEESKLTQLEDKQMEETTMSNTQAKVGTPINSKQVKWMLGVLAVIVFGLANTPQTQAQVPTDSGPEVTRTREKDTTRQQQTVHNPCTEEDVLLDTTIRTEAESRQDANRFRSRFRTHEQGKGFAVGTFAKYEYQAMSDNRFESTVNTFETRFDSRQRLNRNRNESPLPPEKKDDFFIRTRIRTKVVNGELVESQIEETQPDKTCK